MTKIVRTGAVGALLHIYEDAFAALQIVIATIPDHTLSIVADPHTSDENCRSIQSILSHVVHSGYGYATSIHNLKEHPVQRPDKIVRVSTREYQEDLADVFTYTENVFQKIKDSDLEELDHSLKIKTGWGQWYDIEQMMEHAIVHVLRHKRQIEKFKIVLGV